MNLVVTYCQLFSPLPSTSKAFLVDVQSESWVSPHFPRSLPVQFQIKQASKVDPMINLRFSNLKVCSSFSSGWSSGFANHQAIHPPSRNLSTWRWSFDTSIRFHWQNNLHRPEGMARCWLCKAKTINITNIDMHSKYKTIQSEWRTWDTKHYMILLVYKLFQSHKKNSFDLRKVHLHSASTTWKLRQATVSQRSGRMPNNEARTSR